MTSSRSPHRRPTKGRIAWLLVLAVLIGLSIHRYGSRPTTHGASLDGQAFGTTWAVKLGTSLDGTELAALRVAVRDTLAHIDERFSTYRDDSELARFNAHRSTTPTSVSPEMVALMQQAQALSTMTDGAFDVTVAPLVAAWGFGADGRRDAPEPSEELLVELTRHVGMDLLIVDASAATLEKRDPEVVCDLSAIAKGHGVDALAEALERRGVRHYMVEIGGEVRARGHKHDGEAWRIGIEAPGPRRGVVTETVALDGQAIATSGTYRNYRDVAAGRVAHVIDPRTARPTDGEVLSVSVARPTTAEADALATALLVMGLQEGRRFAEEHDLAVMWIARRNDGAAARVMTQSFRALRVPASTTSDEAPASSLVLVAVIGLVALAMALMGLGTALGRPLRGSCGGSGAGCACSERARDECTRRGDDHSRATVEISRLGKGLSRRKDGERLV